MEKYLKNEHEQDFAYDFLWRDRRIANVSKMIELKRYLTVEKKKLRKKGKLRGFYFMDEKSIKGLEREEDELERQTKDMMEVRPHRITQPPSDQARLTWSYLGPESIGKHIDESLLCILPPPRSYLDRYEGENTGFMQSEQQQATHSFKSKGYYAENYLSNLGLLLNAFLSADHKPEVQERVSKLIEEILNVENFITPMSGKRGRVWNRYIEMLDPSDRQYKYAPIFFLEKYISQRVLEIVEEYNVEEDLYAPEKLSLLPGSKETVIDTINYSLSPSRRSKPPAKEYKWINSRDEIDFDTLIDVPKDLADEPSFLEGGDPGEVETFQRLLQKLTLSGKVDRDATGLDALSLKLEQEVNVSTVRDKEGYFQRKEEKKALIERLERERREKRFAEAESIFDIEVDPSEKLDLEGMYDDVDLDEDPEFSSTYMKFSEREISEGADKRFEENIEKIKSQTKFSYFGRGEGLHYVADVLDDKNFGMRDFYGHTDFEGVSTFLRDDSLAASEKLTESKDLLLLAGNAGIEMVTSLLFLDAYLHPKDKAVSRRATVHLAAPNRHVSMATKKDVRDALDFLKDLSHPHGKGVAQRIEKAIENEALVLQTPAFYDSPLPFWAAPDSFRNLTSSHDFVLSTSDHHYRRLTGDLSFDPQFSFSRVTRTIFPSANLLALRPLLHPGTVIGIPIPAVTRAMLRLEATWDIAGVYSVISLRDRNYNPGWYQRSHFKEDELSCV
eukprot:CAMPEP_0167770244 /NCGR_PEP_ID=MMETSP0110_2-20121227/17810_1 /TAXON_ID=629695 /ORGANISM="Gymnochlora sp., Strain CCMP2014" /LENGTH=728 /DNA_ID=CAMNT_0007659397 /DNA_START=164 /DNA_END=2350 /DNA_ORIENTATION=+